MLLQIIGLFVFLGIIAIILANIKKREGDILLFSSIAMMIILIFFVLFPDTMESFILSLGFIRVFDSFLTLISMTSLVLAFVLYIKIKKMEQDMTKIVREITLSEKKKE